MGCVASGPFRARAVEVAFVGQVAVVFPLPAVDNRFASSFVYEVLNLEVLGQRM